MTGVLHPQVAPQPAMLTVAAGALLARAIGRYSATGSPLSEADIPMEPQVLRSHLGSGARPVTADQAWEELAANGLITGTRQQWAPVTEGVDGHGA
ncbi:hypothetical protein [Dietzia sp. 179-F 9C3 NHS]|uniref:hypothetical protein n=1 Tax=Dietzia sp. 179-F 9C3 NHS TaxID=3374295 RepID=UPI00387A46A7